MTSHYDKNIYVLNHWIQLDIKDVYIFNGSNKVDKEDYKDKHTRIIYEINEYIYGTDTMETIRYKIAKFCMKNKNIKDIYLWGSCEFNENDKYNFLNNLYKKQLKLTREYINEVTYVYFNRKYYEKDLDKKELMEDFEIELDKKEILKSLDFTFTTLYDHDLLLSPNPLYQFKESDYKEDELVKTDYLKTMLFRFRLNKNEFNFISQEVEHNIDDIYFKNKYNYENSYEKIMKSRVQIQNNFEDMNELMDNIHNRIEVLYFRVLPYSHDIKINMKTLFSITNTSYNIPFIVYKSKFTSEYKINKIALTDMDKKQIDIFYQQEVKYQNNISNRANDTMIFYVKMSSSLFYYVLLSDNGSYRIKYKFNKTHDYKIEDIYESFETLQEIYKDIDEYSIYKLSRDVKLFNSTMIDIIEYNTHNTITFKKPINDSIFNKNIRTINPFFEFNKVLKNSIIQVQYMDTNNFYNTDTITSFIYNHYELTKSELIEKMQFYFKMTEEDAKTTYEEKKNNININISKKGNNIFAIRPYHTAVSVRLNILSDYSVKINTVNTQDNVYLDCILYYLINYLTKPVVKTKSGVASSTTNVSNTKSNTNLSDNVNFNDLVDIDDFDIGNIDDLGIDVDSPVVNIETDIGDIEDDEEVSINIDDDEDTELVNESGKKTDYTTFVLDKLYRADRKLFLWKNISTNLKNYSSKCGAVNFRQPIVINKEEKENIDKNHQGSYTGFVKTGSTPELREKNFYICPKIWCRVSRVSITEEEYKKYGDKCPPPYNEEAMFFPKKGSKTNYFITKDGTEEHWPSLLKKSKHPLNFELPCCGKKPPSKNKNNKDELSQGLTSNYISNISSELLLDENQYGNLPFVLNKILNKNAVCTGIMDSKKQCFVRTGVNNDNLVLFTIFEKLLKIKNIRKHIAENLKIEEFIFLNGGNTLKVFMNNDEQCKILDKKYFKEFKTYFLENKDYIRLFDLEKEYNYIKVLEKLEMKNDSMTKSIIREFLIVNAFINFKHYIIDKNTPKQLEYFMHMLTFEWLNPNKYNFLFLSIDKEDMYFMNPKYYDFNEYYDKQNKNCIILKLISGFEYISHLSQKKNVTNTYIESSMIEPILNSVLNTDLSKLDKIYGEDVEGYVLSPNIKCTGLIVENSFVPLKEEVMLQYEKIKSKKIIYTDKLDKYSLKKSILKRFEVEMTKEEKDELKDMGKIDMDLFVQEWNNKHYETEEQRLFHENLYQVVKKISKKEKLVDAVHVLASAITNFNMDQKLTLLKKILKQYKVSYDSNIDEKEMLMTIIRIPISKIMNDYKLKLQRANKTDIYMTYNDILDKKLDDYYDKYKNNKFKVFDTSIEDYVYGIDKIDKQFIKDTNKNIVWTSNRAEIKPKTLQDKLLNYHIIDEEITYEKLINFANDLDKKITLEKFEEKLRERIMNIYTKEDGRNEIYELYDRNKNFKNHKFTKNSVSMDKYIELIHNDSYHYSFFELEVLAKMLKCNIIILGRDTNVTPKGVHVIKVNTNRYIIMMFTILENRHVFNLVIKKDSSKEIYQLNELKDDFSKVFKLN